jgi:hypothetical protein
MGLFDKLKEKAGGGTSAVRPQSGVDPEPAEQVRRRLLAITGRGIETSSEGDEIVVSWSAKLESAGAAGVGKESLYRAVRLSLNEEDRVARARSIDRSSEAGGGPGGLSASKSWSSGKQWGTQGERVLSWGGPHRTEGGADESGFKFSWSQLHDPVIEAITRAGWTYKPQ